MSSAVSRPPLPTGGPSAGGDEFDDLNDYDIELDDPTDPFGNNYQVSQDKTAPKTSEREKGKGGDGLGLDEEVEVTRKARAPRVKLDEHRLLSAAGIPKLRKKAREHLKFKGKGHEYSDAARLLAFYQLWLDDLFPKARFLDALAMVEKMGHKKMMQSARMEWINEGKPHSGVHEDSLFDEPQVQPKDKTAERATSRVAPIFEKGKEGERNKTPAGNVDDLFGDDEDIYGATPKAARKQQPAASNVGGGTSLFGPAKNTDGDDEFPDDDIDALLAEEESMRTSKPTAKPIVQEDDNMDDMDALLAEEEAIRVEKPASKPAGGQDDDIDDIDTLLAEEEVTRAERPAKAASKAPAGHNEEFDDDMEAMAEMDGLWE